MSSYSYRNRSRDFNRLHIITHVCHVKIDCLKELILGELLSGNKNHDYNAREIEFIKEIKMRNCDRPNVIPLVVPFKFIRKPPTI